MNIKQAAIHAHDNSAEVTGEHFLRGKMYFCVIDTTNDESIIVNHIAGAWWDAGPAAGPLRRGDAIRFAVDKLVSQRRNK